MAFQGFRQITIKVKSEANVFAYQRDGDAKLPVLLLLHGYPQNNLMWKHFVNEIPSEWRLLVPDLPGYGHSEKPIDRSNQSLSHSKREWAKDMIEMVDEVYGTGTTIIPYGHDRGARLAYRMALLYPQQVVGAAMLDIVPTAYVWDAMRLEKGHLETKRSHHWVFLSAPYPLPETMIASNPTYYFRYTMTSWCRKSPEDDLDEWILDSIKPYWDPVKGKGRIAAACEDYRAGATHDIVDDYAALINPLSNKPASFPPPFNCPLLVLSSGHLRRRFDVDHIWQSLAKPGMVQSFRIGDETTGHFLVNEEQEEVGRRTREWLGLFASSKQEKS